MIFVNNGGTFPLINLNLYQHMFLCCPVECQICTHLSVLIILLLSLSSPPHNSDSLYRITTQTKTVFEIPHLYYLTFASFHTFINRKWHIDVTWMKKKGWLRSERHENIQQLLIRFGYEISVISQPKWQEADLRSNKIVRS